jgi:hypothetical protein
MSLSYKNKSMKWQDGLQAYLGNKGIKGGERLSFVGKILNYKL